MLIYVYMWGYGMGEADTLGQGLTRGAGERGERRRENPVDPLSGVADSPASC